MKKFCYILDIILHIYNIKSLKSYDLSYKDQYYKL